MNTVTVGELKHSGYALAKRDFGTPAIELLNYIDFLSMNNGVASDDFPLEFITDPDTAKKRLAADKQAINKLFFERVEAKAAQKIEKPPLDPKIIESIKAANEQRKQREASRLEDTIKSCAIAIRDRQQTIAREIAVIRGNREKIAALNIPSDMGEMIKSIEDAIMSSNWEFKSFSQMSNEIDFANKTDVILVHVNKSLGRDFKLNCGKFRLRINLVTMDILMMPFEKNVPGSVMHPHALANSEPCWGNAADTVTNAKINGDIGTILKILDSMLQNYNDSSPYLNIASFAEVVERRDGAPPVYGSWNRQGYSNNPIPNVNFNFRAQSDPAWSEENDSEDTLDDEMEEDYEPDSEV